LTLVVARKGPGSITAVADTKLAPENQREWSFADQSNKIICLAQGWCLAYAGNIAYAEGVARQFLTRTDLSFSELRNALSLANQQSIDAGSAADFLLFSSPAASIHKFSEGKHTRTANSAWIGTTTAFSKFQEVIHFPGESHPLLGNASDDPTRMVIVDSHLKSQDDDGRDEALLNRMRRALGAVIDDDTIPDVGGFTVSLFIDSRGRNFWPEVAMYPTAKIPPSPIRDQMFGTAQSGDYNYELIAGRDGRSNFLAVYFRLTERAMIFHAESELPQGNMIGELPANLVHDILEARFGVPVWRVLLSKKSDGSYGISSVGYPY
jgi:hypothetical protein